MSVEVLISSMREHYGDFLKEMVRSYCDEKGCVSSIVFLGCEINLL